ncbi:MAG: hypothetical protein HC923_09320, partial [Myxococcales bacterium]|nr:hypothetical protein [Myxococcales bacterium]
MSMCGLAGWVAPEGGRVDLEILQRMTRAVARRGPDDEGYHVDERCGLGHRRLSIIDLSGGRQPLSSADGRVQAIVNGEIYNFRELRRELEAAGYPFRTGSDSEVIVHGHLHWGLELPKKLDGMFAYAIWDRFEQKLTLARDPLGKKPLYYSEIPEGFLFGSELKVLLAHPAYRPSLDRGALATYLVQECYPEELSVFEGTHKVKPGEAVVYDARRRRWTSFYHWVPRFGSASPSPPFTGGEHEMVRRLEHALLRAVEKRLVADVPIELPYP